MNQPTPSWRQVIALVVLALALIGLVAPPLSAQNDPDQNDEAQRSLQAIIAEAVLEDGWWDESGSLSVADMNALVTEFGDDFSFAYTDRSFEVQQDPNQNPAGLLAQSTLDILAGAEGPTTLLFVTGDQIGGATTAFPFFNVGQVMADFDRSDPPASFATAARELIALGDTFAPIPEGATTESAVDNTPTGDPETGIFAGMRILIILAIVAGALALASVISARNKAARRAVTTSDARDSTKDELQAMSDLILDLDPRVTLADDKSLKARFVDASSTYRDVLEKADAAETGHEVADLRIDISKARWKLDVIDAELSGRTPPKEPFTRDNTGSAWDSTRGRGNDS